MMCWEIPHWVPKVLLDGLVLDQGGLELPPPVAVVLAAQGAKALAGLQQAVVDVGSSCKKPL